MAAPNKALEGLERLYETRYFSDLTIVCGDREWKMHRSVVCFQSEFFMKACTGEFLEAAERKIDLSDDDPQAVDAMLEFFYKQDYGDGPDETDAAKEAMLHVRVYGLADKYDIHGLENHSFDKFKPVATYHWREKSFADIIPEIFNDSPEYSPLKAFLTEVLCHNAVDILTEDEDLKPVKDAITALPELAVKIACALAEQNKRLAASVPPTNKQYYCPGCDDCIEGPVFGEQLRGLGGMMCPGCDTAFSEAEWDEAATDEGEGEWDEGATDE